MNLQEVQQICETRILVGYLGEKQQTAWWGSSFLSSTSKAFLAPTYPNSIAVAQYSGVCQAASIVHDEHIGIGKHYHLYRLPDSIERSLLKCVQNPEFTERLFKHIVGKEAAVNRLKELGQIPVEKSEGPIAVGNYTDDNLDTLIRSSRSYYIDAVKSGYKTFPYMRCY